MSLPATGLATISSRLAAVVIDSLLVSLAVLALAWPLALVVADGTADWLVPVFEWVAWLCAIAVLAAMESSPAQASPGKRVFGLAVTDLDGRRSGFLRAFVRNLAKQSTWFLLGLGFLLALFTPRRQALHDLFAGTQVVRRADAPHLPVLQGLLVAAGLLGPLLIVVALAVPALQDYRHAVHEVEQANARERDRARQQALAARMSATGTLFAAAVQGRLRADGALPDSLDDMRHLAPKAAVRGARVEVLRGGALRLSSDDGALVLHMRPQDDGRGGIEWRCRAEGFPPQVTLPAVCGR